MPGRQRVAHTPKAREGEEIWETTTPGRVWVTTTDDRGREKQISVGPGVGQRLRLKSTDREVAQDSVLDDASDPFTNGLLKRVDADQQLDASTKSDQALDTDQLLALFAKKGNAFQAAVAKLNELNVRRLSEMAEAADASASQIAHLKEVIVENYRQEGDTPTYREIKATPQGVQLT